MSLKSLKYWILKKQLILSSVSMLKKTIFLFNLICEFSGSESSNDS